MRAGSAALARATATARESGTPAVCAVSVGLTVLGLLLYLENRSTPGTERFFDPVMPAVALTFPALGAFIVTRRPDTTIGWLLCTGAVLGAAFFAEQYAVNALEVAPGSLPGAGLMAWLGSWLWIPGYLALLTFLLLLFPDGRLPSGRWKLLAWVAATLISAACFMGALAPDSLNSLAPAGLAGIEGLPVRAGTAHAIGVFVVAPLCWWSLRARYRRATVELRRQLRWPVLAAGLAVLVPLATALASLTADAYMPLGLYQLAVMVTLVGVPVAIAAAIHRHGLYGLPVRPDTLINRLCVYGVLAGVGTGLFAAAYALLHAVVEGHPRFPLAIVSLLLGATAVGWLRDRVQRSVDHLFYRTRRYDQRVVNALGQSLRSTVGHDALLPALVNTIAVGLRLPFVAMAVGRPGEMEASAAVGDEPEAAVPLPLTYQNECVGRLVVAPRSAKEPFDSTDRRLLDHIAGQAAVVAYALCLSTDLRQSRRRLVAVREEERRRLRRDLHDGVQPALAGVSLGLDAARNLLAGQGEADELLAQLRSELETAGADLRRLVYGLRPPALDRLGLAGAVRQQAATLSMSPTSPEVVVEAPDDLLGELPAAVEVAVYRICQEALENVRKHAQAASCEVTFSVVGEELHLEVRDDGVGIRQDARAGVGLAAMSERAAELGGACAVESVPGSGTCVRVVLPLSQQ